MSPVLLFLAVSITGDPDLDNLLQTGGRVLAVLILALLAIALIRRVVRPLVRVAVREPGEPPAELAKRIETLSDVVNRTTAVVVLAVAVVTILPEFGISAGPLIAGLGLVGLAVGFGAQNLVRDVINGIEILVENQYARGDYVRLGGVSGFVEDINLRRTVLRDFDGAVHFVSHGHVDVTSNYTRGASRVNFNVFVSYGADLARVLAVIDRVGAELARDPAYAALIRQPPQAAGVDGFGEASLQVRVEAVTEPGAQWRVAGELRRRIKLACDAEGLALRP